MSWMAAFQNNVHNIIAIVFTVTVSCPTSQRGKRQGPTQQCCSRNSSLLAPATIWHCTPSMGHSDRMQQLTCMSLMQANWLWLFPEEVAFLHAWDFQRYSTMHGGKLPGKELGAGQEAELKSGRGSGHHARGWVIPPVYVITLSQIFFSHDQVLLKRCYYVPKKGASCTLTAAPTNSHNIRMLEKRNRLLDLPSLFLPASTISMH